MDGVPPKVKRKAMVPRNSGQRPAGGGELDFSSRGPVAEGSSDTYCIIHDDPGIPVWDGHPRDGGGGGRGERDEWRMMASQLSSGPPGVIIARNKQHILNTFSAVIVERVIKSSAGPVRNFISRSYHRFNAIFRKTKSRPHPPRGNISSTAPDGEVHRFSATRNNHHAIPGSPSPPVVPPKVNQICDVHRPTAPLPTILPPTPTSQPNSITLSNRIVRLRVLETPNVPRTDAGPSRGGVMSVRHHLVVSTSQQPTTFPSSRSVEKDRSEQSRTLHEPSSSSSHPPLSLPSLQPAAGTTLSASAGGVPKEANRSRPDSVQEIVPPPSWPSRKFPNEKAVAVDPAYQTISFDKVESESRAVRRPEGRKVAPPAIRFSWYKSEGELPIRAPPRDHPPHITFVPGDIYTHKWLSPMLPGRIYAEMPWNYLMWTWKEEGKWIRICQGYRCEEGPIKGRYFVVTPVKRVPSWVTRSTLRGIEVQKAREANALAAKKEAHAKSN
ncbi:hypothetical protein JAAARDRAFT_47789 [Jaapia argillacea MUCL 33604]|uniref:Uncharacterized protein n=1 Tax=Jaapia argillacea MUCL 33604 TaxID=933084 RepID=A0A067Q3H0_9AGAM|nr:hypothetical protein JAAARDRAFT_47789 [Jaapia argillacea MUCL 33604]